MSAAVKGASIVLPSISISSCARNTTTTEEAWRFVEQACSVPPVITATYTCIAAEEVEASTTSSTNTNTLIRLNSSTSNYLLPLKKRHRVILSEQLENDGKSTTSLCPLSETVPTQIPEQQQPVVVAATSTVMDSSTALVSKLPHLLPSFQEIYNRNGHVGIYNAQQRAAILSRFHKKRLARKWKKKIRYDCRKDLADKRVRVKGRFVKGGAHSNNNNNNSQRCASPSSSAGSMPDVTDVEAAFDPNEDSPFRRTRRVTVP